jgi:trigger factor
MSTATSCWREIELEIPAEQVQAEEERIARELARVARVPGFRPGRAPVSLIRRRFADDIRSEVIQNLVPDWLEKALAERGWQPVSRPRVERVDFADTGALRFTAAFEVLPEFELQPYRGLEVEVEAVDVTEADVERALEQLREQMATLVPVEGRAAQDGDYVLLKLTGTPAGGGEPVHSDNAVCRLGDEETLPAFTENLRGAVAGETRRFEVTYPEDFPDPKLRGRRFTFRAEVVAVKEKKLPELDDAFARATGQAETLEELRTRLRQQLEQAREERQRQQVREKVLDRLVAMYDFPVPEALVERQLDARLERAVRRLLAQGIDPRGLNVDWAGLRQRQRERALADVRAEILLDRIAQAEGIEVTEEEFAQQLERMARRTGESVEALRARLTREGVLDTMKAKARSEKTLDWLCQQARIQMVPRSR